MNSERIHRVAVGNAPIRKTNLRVAEGNAPNREIDRFFRLYDLDLKQVINLAKTNRKFLDMLDEDYFWQRLLNRDFPMIRVNGNYEITYLDLYRLYGDDRKMV
jgi:hypothetical protein